MSTQAHGARWVLGLGAFALLFAPGRSEWPAEPADGRELLEARLLAPTLREAMIGAPPKPSGSNLRSGAHHRSGAPAVPLDVIDSAGAAAVMWAAFAAGHRRGVGPRFFAFPACIPRGPPSFQAN